MENEKWKMKSESFETWNLKPTCHLLLPPAPASWHF
jgi:hypothetical protein